MLAKTTYNLKSICPKHLQFYMSSNYLESQTQQMDDNMDGNGRYHNFHYDELWSNILILKLNGVVNIE